MLLRIIAQPQVSESAPAGYHPKLYGLLQGGGPELQGLARRLDQQLWMPDAQLHLASRQTFETGLAALVGLECPGRVGDKDMPAHGAVQMTAQQHDARLIHHQLRGGGRLPGRAAARRNSNPAGAFGSRAARPVACVPRTWWSQRSRLAKRSCVPGTTTVRAGTKRMRSCSISTAPGGGAEAGAARPTG